MLPQLVAAFWLLLTSALVACDAATFEWSRACQPIPQAMRLCRGVGYTQMRLPNALNQESVAEVLQQTEHWLPLAGTGCHADLRILLCSVYAPICIRHQLPAAGGGGGGGGAGRQIQPCDSLCRSVRQACLPVMRKFGFAWPAMLNCSQFPPETDLMCIKGTTGGGSTSTSPGAAQSDAGDPPAPSAADCDACPDKVSYASIIARYCLSEIALKVRIDRPERVDGGLLRLRFRGRSRLLNPPSQPQPQQQLPTLAEIAPGCRCRALESQPSPPPPRSGSQQSRQRHYLAIGTILPPTLSSAASAAANVMRVRLLVVWDRAIPKRSPLKLSVRAIRRSADRRSLCSQSRAAARVAAAAAAPSPDEQLRRRRRQRQRRRRRLRRQRLRRNGGRDQGRGKRARRGRKGDRAAAKTTAKPAYRYDSYYYINHNAGRD